MKYNNIILCILILITLFIVLYSYSVIIKLDTYICEIREEYERRDDYIRELETENYKTLDMVKKITNKI